jgi:hypothetical protein
LSSLVAAILGADSGAVEAFCARLRRRRFVFAPSATTPFHPRGERFLEINEAYLLHQAGHFRLAVFPIADVGHSKPIDTQISRE